MPDPLILFDDLELFLTGWFRTALAARPEPICAGVLVDRTEPDGDASTWPEKVLVIRDDGTTDDEILTGSASIGLTVLAGTKTSPKDAKDLARIVYAMLLQIPSGDPLNPVAAIGSRNGPFMIAEAQPRARVYTAATLRVAARAH